MSATFPHITPNTTPQQHLPSNHGRRHSDNFGISDAVRFHLSFPGMDFVVNTDGIVIISIRDSPKLSPIAEQQGNNFIDDITQPIG